mgnify:CR=1 FL=1
MPYAESVVGSFMYAMLRTRSDIAHAIGVVSQFMSNPGKKHKTAVKWILWYLRVTSRVYLCFGPRQPVLDGYTDANMSGDIDSSKSTLVFTVKVSFTLPRMPPTMPEPNIFKEDIIGFAKWWKKI